MSHIDIDDGDGHSATLFDIDGYRMSVLCDFSPIAEPLTERLKCMDSMPCKEGDVFICAPVKSGTHWTWEIVSMLLNNNAETIPIPKVRHMLEATSQRDIININSPRVFNTHLHIKYLPKEIGPKKCKIVFVLRNPKSVAASLYNHLKGINAYTYNGKWEHFLPMFLEGKMEYGDWFDYVLEWEELIAKNKNLLIHTVYYEDLKENTLDEIYRLGEFLGVKNEDSLFERVSEKCQFEKMQKDKMYVYQTDRRKIVFRGDFSMFRKGEIEDWKNWFTVAQNEAFDKLYAERMKNSKLRFRYESSK